MTKQKKNLWLLSEERPKNEVIHTILCKFAKDKKLASFIDNIRILPLSENGKFSFTYEVLGFQCNQINKVFIKCISGYSSFVDFLIFYQDKEPVQNDIPTHAIEETKTTDNESRNTGVYQRATKFVFLDLVYDPKIHSVKKVMLYNNSEDAERTPSKTYEFGAKLFATIGVETIRVGQSTNNFSKFCSIDEIIDFKENMRPGRRGNKPIIIKKKQNSIIITGNLLKSNYLAHDPNIGALSLIASAIRKLKWKNKIIIEDHGLEQSHITKKNKFIKISYYLNLEISGLQLPQVENIKDYWRYETKGEKLATIFVHLVIENFTRGYSLFENHAGSEKSYFQTKDGKHIPLKKYYNREAYKDGDKTQIISIPDIIMIDIDRNKILNIEGKTYENCQNGIKELEEYWKIEEVYIKPNYPKYEIIRTLVLYGGNATSVDCIKVGFLLNEAGDMILGIEAPELFREAIKNFLDYWQS